MATSSFPRFEGDYIGGFVFDLCEKLVYHGVDITVLAPRSRAVEGGFRDLSVHRFPFMPSKRQETIPEQTLKHLSFHQLPQLPTYLASAFLHISREKFDLLHAHSAIPMGFLGASIPREAPLLVTCHGSDCTLPIEKPFFRPFVRRALRKSKRIVAVSEFVKGLTLKLGADEKKVEVVYQGIDVQKFRPDPHRKRLLEEIGIEGGTVIGTLSRLVPEKRIEDFLRSASLVQREIDAHFLIGGDGFLRPRLEMLADELDLTNVRFLGEIWDAASFHRLCDVFVLTSIREGLSISLQEAMATGAVPVAVKGYGCPELVRDDQNGYLFRPMDVEDLAHKILLASRSPELGRTARSTIVEHFDINKNVKRYIEIYAELARR